MDASSRSLDSARATPRPAVRAEGSAATKGFKGAVCPGVISLHIGSVVETALLRVAALNVSIVDAIATVSVVRTPLLSGGRSTEDDASVLNLLDSLSRFHTDALLDMQRVVHKLEVVGSEVSSGTPSEGGAAHSAILGGIAAVGGAVYVSDGQPAIDGATALAGLHMCDGDDEDERDEFNIPEEAFDDAAAVSGSVAARKRGTGTGAASVYETADAIVARARTRPVYVSRVRYETSSPNFDSWLRLRFSRLSSTSAVVITIFDFKVPSDPTPLAVTFLPVGAATTSLAALRNCSPSAAGLGIRRSSISTLMQSLVPGGSMTDVAAINDKAASLVSLVVRSAKAPVGLLSGSQYVFHWVPIPIGTPPNSSGKEQVFGEAGEVPVSGVHASHSRMPFLSTDSLPMWVYDQFDRLLPPSKAAAAYAGMTVQAALRTSSPIRDKSFRSIGKAGDLFGVATDANSSPKTALDAASVTPAVYPALTVHWRADTDVDFLAVRGALVLRSVGVSAGHPLALLPAEYLRQLGDTCRPHAEKFHDIASVLPVLEPLFRFVSGEETRRSASDKLKRMRARTRGGGGSPRSPRSPRASGGQGGGGGRSARASAAPEEREGSGEHLSEGEEEDDEPKGLDERIFVGICAHCTNLPERALRKAFRQLDANGDTTLLWDEFVSYISRLLDNDLAKRAAQGTYLLIPPQDAQPIAGAGGGSKPTAPTTGEGPGGINTMKSSLGKALTSAGLHIRGLSGPPMSPVAAVVQAMVSPRTPAGSGGKLSPRTIRFGFGEEAPIEGTTATGSASSPPIVTKVKSTADKLKPPSQADALVGIEPAKCVKANADGISTMVVLPELQGFGAAYRNHSVQILDDGFREALEIDLHSGLNLVNEILPQALLNDMSAASKAEINALAQGVGGGATSLLPVHGMDWCGENVCVLAIVCADRRLRTYELAKYVSYGSSALKDLVQRRVNAEMIRLQNQYEKDIQSALVTDSIRHRKAGLAELSKRSHHLKGGDTSGSGENSANVFRTEDVDVLDQEAFLLRAVLSVNIANPFALRDEFDKDEPLPSSTGTSSGTGGVDGSSGRGGAAGPSNTPRNSGSSSAGGGATKPSHGASVRGSGGELEDIIDYGRGKDYLRLRSSKATGMALALRGAQPGEEGDDLDSGASASAMQRNMRTFGGGGSSDRNKGKGADPRLQALASAARGEATTFRRVGGAVGSLQRVEAASFTSVRSLKEGMPTCVKLVTLKLYARHHSGFDPRLSSTAVPASMLPRARQNARPVSDDVVFSNIAPSSQVLTAVIGDNRGILTAHRLLLGSAAHSSPPGAPHTSNTSFISSLKTPIGAITSLVVLPSRDAEASTSDGIVLSSSTSTIVAGGHAGPITIVTVALGYDKKALLAGGSTGSTFRLSIIRVLNSDNPLSHEHGVTTMAYCSSERCLVTTGVDRKILLWNVTDTARSDAQIGQLGTTGAIASERDAIVSIATNDIHSQVITLTRGGRIEVFDPRTLACIQRINDEGVPSFNKGAVVDPLHMCVVTYGSHIRSWSIREAFLNTVNAAVAVAQSVANEHRLAFLGEPVSGGRGAGGQLSTAETPTFAPREADSITAMAATTWTSIAEGYERESHLIPKVSPVVPRQETPDEELKHKGDTFVEMVAFNKLASRLKSHARDLVQEKQAIEREEALKAARRTSVTAEDIATLESLKEQLGGRLVRRGSIESQLIVNMVEELHKHGRSVHEEAADTDDVEVGGATAQGGGGGGDSTGTSSTGGGGGGGSGPSSTAQDGRALLAALFSSAFNQVATVARDGLVKIFELTSGKMVMSFLADHSRRDEMVGLGAAQRFFPAPSALGATPVQLTAASLDLRQRRLITGSIFGSVRIFNLSNGMLLRNLIPAPAPAEITSLAYHPGATVTYPVIAGTNNGKLAWWKDFGRIADDTLGQGAQLADAVSKRDAHSARIATAAVNEGVANSSARRAHDEEEMLLNIHVRAGDHSVSIVRASLTSPAARLRKNLRVAGNGEGGFSDSWHGGGGGVSDMEDIARFLTTGASPAKLSGTIRHTLRPQPLHELASPMADPRTTLAAGANAPSSAMMSLPGGLSASKVSALTSPRYLSIEARGIVSSARAEISLEHGVALLSKVAFAPRAPMRPDLHARVTGGGRPPKGGRVTTTTGRDSSSSHASMMAEALADDSGVAHDITMDLAFERRHGRITVQGGSGEASSGGGLASASGGLLQGLQAGDAVAAEAMATFQRLAPHVVDVPDGFTSSRRSSRDDTMGRATGSGGSARASRGSGSSTSTPFTPSQLTAFKLRALQSEVVCVAAGGGVLDATMPHIGQGTRTPPWVLTCTTDGIATLWNPTTERPHSTVQLYDGELNSTHLSHAVITCCTVLSNHGLVAIGTQTGNLHIMSVVTGKLLWSGQSFGGEKNLTGGEGARFASDASVGDDELRTGFFTLPTSTEWAQVRRGVATTIYLPTDAIMESARPPTIKSKSRRRPSVVSVSAPEASKLRSVGIRGVTCIVANALNTRLLVGYEGGFARVFDTWQLQNNAWLGFTVPTAEWRPNLTKYGFTQADLVATSSGQEYFLTAGGFDAKLWSTEGHFIALFGQSAAWPVALALIANESVIGTASVRQSDDIIQGMAHAHHDGKHALQGGATSATPLRVSQHAGVEGTAASKTAGDTSPRTDDPTEQSCTAFSFGWSRPVGNLNDRQPTPVTGRTHSGGGYSLSAAPAGGSGSSRGEGGGTSGGESEPSSPRTSQVQVANYDRRGSMMHLIAARRHSALTTRSARASAATSPGGSDSMGDERRGGSTANPAVPRSERKQRNTTDATTALASHIASSHGDTGEKAVRQALSDSLPLAQADLRTRLFSTTVGMNTLPLVTRSSTNSMEGFQVGPSTSERRASLGRQSVTFGSSAALALGATTSTGGDKEEGDTREVEGAAPTSASVRVGLDLQRRKHDIRLAKKEARMEELPNAAQNPFDYLGSGKWLSKRAVD